MRSKVGVRSVCPIVLRCVAALVGIVASWLAYVPTAIAAVPVASASVATFSYSDVHDAAAPMNNTAERGPPAPSRRATLYDADGLRSFGASVRPSGTTPRATYDYNHPRRLVETPRRLVETARGSQAAESQARDLAEHPGVVRHSRSAAKTTTSLVGKKYGLGTVVENPGLTIQGFRGAKNPSHGLNQIINRGVSPSMLRNTVANPKVVLEQGSGNFVHIADDAVVVLRPDGQLVTTYGRSDFKQHIFDILADVG